MVYLNELLKHLSYRGNYLLQHTRSHFWKYFLLLGTLIPLSIHFGPVYYVQALLMWSAVFSLALGLFRFDVMNYLKGWIPSVLLMSIVTAFIQSHEMLMLVTTAQPLLAIICLILLFGFHWLHATIMMIVTYATCIILEILTIYFLLSDDVLGRLREFNQLEGYIISFINFVLIFILRKTRWGFSFLSRRHKQVDYGHTAGVFIGLLLMSLNSVSLLIADLMSVTLMTILFLGLLGFYIAAYRKEWSEG